MRNTSVRQDTNRLRQLSSLHASWDFVCAKPQCWMHDWHCIRRARSVRSISRPALKVHAVGTLIAGCQRQKPQLLVWFGLPLCRVTVAISFRRSSHGDNGTGEYIVSGLRHGTVTVLRKFMTCVLPMRANATSN